MKILYYCLILLNSLPMLSFARTAELSGKTVIFCVEDGEWPPFNFIKRQDGQKTQESIGYDIDVVTAILSEHKIKAKFVIQPWRRCLKKTKNGLFQVALSASSSAQRERDYLLSAAYYSLTPSYFYLKKKFPNGLAIKSAVDLKKHGEICGRHGYNYANFGLKNTDVRMGAKTYKNLVEMTLKGRCDIFLARYETFSGVSLIGENLLADPRFERAPISNVKPENFHMLISRNYKYAEQLQLILDSGILRLKRAGQLQAILKKYQPSNHPIIKSTD